MAWAAALLVIGGCVRSINPVLKEDQYISNDAVLGNWIKNDGKDSAVVSVGTNPREYHLLYVDGDGKQADLVANLGKLGDKTIVQCTVADPTDHSASSGVYWLHLQKLYTFAWLKEIGPRLVLTTIDPDWLKKYLDAHPSELAIVKLDKDNFVISATTDELQAFLLAHQNDAEAFTENGIYVRPGDPSTQPAASPK
jgi:hypothetical protein